MKLLKAIILLFLILITPFTFFSLLQLFQPAASPSTIIVLGASVFKDAPTGVTKLRLDTAYQLYASNASRNLLLLGYRYSDNYDEPTVMKDYLLAKGVPESHIQTDNQSFNTLLSCVRAHDLYGIKDAYLVTQNFHLPRANFVCRSLNIHTISVPAEDPSIKVTWSGLFREVGASWIALYEVLTKYF